MKFAWIENGRIRDTVPSDPFAWHHADVAKFYDTEVPDTANNGDFYNNGVITPPPVIEYSAPPEEPRTWVAEDIRSKLTLAEKVKWDNNLANEVVTAKQEMASPQLVAHTTEVLDMLVGANVISQTSANKVLE